MGGREETQKDNIKRKEGGGGSNIQTVAMAMGGGDLISLLIRSPPSLR